MLGPLGSVSDVLALELVHSAFWLLVLLVAAVLLWLFREDLRRLLQTITAFKVAGASFEFQDHRETVRSYFLLADTFIDVLSGSTDMEALVRLMTARQAEKLGVFAMKYTTEVEASIWNESLLRNIAHLLIRFGRWIQAKKILDALLERRPNDPDVLNLKGLGLMTARMLDQVREAEDIFSGLCVRYPASDYLRFNHALSLSLLARHDEAAAEAMRAIENGYARKDANMLLDPLFVHTREAKPELLGPLRDALAAALNPRR